MEYPAQVLVHSNPTSEPQEAARPECLGDEVIRLQLFYDKISTLTTDIDGIFTGFQRQIKLYNSPTVSANGDNFLCNHFTICLGLDGGDAISTIVVEQTVYSKGSPALA